MSDARDRALALTGELQGDLAWLGVDWGTSSLRLWAFDADDRPIARRTSDQGMSRLTQAQFEPTLRALAGDWLSNLSSPPPTFVSGMAGAREGWAEAPYRRTPCTPVDEAAQGVRPGGDVFDATILPGLSQMNPPDVMRGEETQLAGLLELLPGFEGSVCIPGTHSKWVVLRGGRVERFQTFMTGELFALLSQQSVLRHVVATGDKANDWPDDEFAAGVKAACASQGAAVAHLFRLRAAALLQGQSPQAARARLSGLMIGAELLAAEPYWRGASVALIDDGGLGALYDRAAPLVGFQPRSRVDAELTTLHGLVRAARSARSK